MPESTLSNSPIVAAYRARTGRSEQLAAEARTRLPSGIAHDIRHLRPYGIYVERGQGARKRDVDGNDYVDYFVGHGALLLGHNHPDVMPEVHAALERGTHMGANNPLEVRWAGLVQELMPSAERVRFTASGTEATHMALRLARAFTSRPKVIRFRSHFHGWHDHMAPGHISHFDGTPTPGVVRGVTEDIILLDPADADGVAETLAARDDVAAVIVEPTGASFGRVPMEPAFLARLRELTERQRTLLVFDEVITGFRVAPGGAQGAFGIRPDLTTLAKILAGGLPGGAVAGRKEVLDELDFEAAAAKGREKIEHPGTFNGNPVSAAAGIATLEIVRSGAACARASEVAAELREGLRAVLVEEGVPWGIYGTFSAFQIFTNPRGRAIDARTFDPFDHAYDELTANRPELLDKLRLAMLVGGVDLNPWPGGMTSSAHGPAEVEQTVSAFRQSLRMLKSEGEL